MYHPAQEAETRQRVVQPTIGGSVYVKPQEIEWEPTQRPLGIFALSATLRH